MARRDGDPDTTNPFEMLAQAMTFRRVVIILATVLVLVIIVESMRGLTGKNDVHTYQIRQTVAGSIEVIDNPGYYMNWFGTAWTYDRSHQVFWSKSPTEGIPGDESIKVHFNDGGTADISAMIKYQMPLEPSKRQELHQLFGGNQRSIEEAVHAHLINCVKNTGPLMSASENQASRKSEFSLVVEEQLRHGIYKMKRTTVALKDRIDEKGQPIMVDATEIVLDEKGIPIIAEESPLTRYGIQVLQFSITGTEYDAQTSAQFQQKQAAYLAAESSKANREKEIQKKLEIEAQSLREVATIEMEANKVKAQAVTQAQQKVEVAAKDKEAAATLADQAAQIATIQAQQAVAVALKTKEAAETAVKQKLSVAEIEKQAAETKAKQDAEVLRIGAEMQLKVAEFEAQAAAKRAEGIIKLAEAKAKEIDIGGAVKEHDKILAEISAGRDKAVAEAISKIQVPSIVISGGQENGKQGAGTGMLETMVSLSLLKSLGIVKDKDIAPIVPTIIAPALTPSK